MSDTVGHPTGGVQVRGVQVRGFIGGVDTRRKQCLQPCQKVRLFHWLTRNNSNPHAIIPDLPGAMLE